MMNCGDKRGFDMQKAVTEALAQAFLDIYNGEGPTPFVFASLLEDVVLDGHFDLNDVASRMIKKLGETSYQPGEPCTVEHVIGTLITMPAEDEIWVETEEHRGGLPFGVNDVQQVTGAAGSTHLLVAIELKARTV